MKNYYVVMSLNESGRKGASLAQDVNDLSSIPEKIIAYYQYILKQLHIIIGENTSLIFLKHILFIKWSTIFLL